MDWMISPYISIVIVAFVAAQGLKYVVAFLKGKRHASRSLYMSGGMPSAHSAVVVALAVAIGLIDGCQSPIFAIALILAAIVMYDAVMIRRSSGEQGDALRRLLKMNKSKSSLFVAHGHTPRQVIVGAIVGGAIAALMVEWLV